jgi:hypothetical protein
MRRPTRRFEYYATWDLWVGVVVPSIIAALVLGGTIIAPVRAGQDVGRWATIVFVAGALFGFVSIMAARPCLAELHRRGQWTPLPMGRHVYLEALAVTSLIGVLTLALLFGAWFVWSLTSL